jgi:hypothetical protein
MGMGWVTKARLVQGIVSVEPTFRTMASVPNDWPDESMRASVVISDLRMQSADHGGVVMPRAASFAELYPRAVAA